MSEPTQTWFYQSRHWLDTISNYIDLFQSWCLPSSIRLSFSSVRVPLTIIFTIASSLAFENLYWNYCAQAEPGYYLVFNINFEQSPNSTQYPINRLQWCQIWELLLIVIVVGWQWEPIIHFHFHLCDRPSEFIDNCYHQYHTLFYILWF